MKNRILVPTILAVVVFTVFAPIAVNGYFGTTREFYLVQKDPSTWQPVEGGAKARIRYNCKHEMFCFNIFAYRLEPYEEYSLIYYADPWPGDNPGAHLGTWTASSLGVIYDGCTVELNMDLPHPDDANYPGGAKLWLVLTSDYNVCLHRMIAWNPTEYLFETQLVTYDDTGVP